MKITLPFLFRCCFCVCLLALSTAESFAQTPVELPSPVAKNIAETKENPVSAEVKLPDTTENLKNSSAPEFSNVMNRIGIQNTQTVPISLNEAIRKALENNNDIEITRTDVRFQETQLRTLLGIYDLVFSVTPTFSRSSSTGSSASNDFRLNAGVDKFLERGGGRVSTFFNNSQTGRNSQNNTAFNQTSALGGNSSSTTYISNLGVNYTQPLFRDFAVDDTRRRIKIQRKRLQQSDADFRRQTLDIISQVQSSYWDLVFSLRDQQNRLANLNLAKENLRQVQVRIDAGAAAPLARAEVATELANRESDVLLATQQVSVTENILKTLLLREPTAPEWTQSFVPTDAPAFSNEPVVVEDALKDAVDNRPELNRLRLQREINAIDIDYFRNQTKPRIDLISSFSLGGLSLGGQTIPDGTTIPGFTGNDELFRLRLNSLLPPDQQIPSTRIPVVGLPSSLTGGTFQSLGNLFRTDSPSYSVGVTIQLPFRNRTAQANLAGAQIQQQQVDAQMRLQEQTIIAQVRNAAQSVETSRQRILTARRARENAEKQLEGERKLFEVGRSTTFLLFQRENALTNARNSEIRAETDYSKSLSDLQRATSTTFRLNNIEIDSPVSDK